MLKTLVRQNNHDFLHQYQWIHPLQKIKILQATVQTSNNKLIKEQKNILPIQFFLNLFLAQKPKIKVAKKSNASFKIRLNMFIGIKNHLHNCKLSLFFVRFICSILPLIKLDTNLTKNSLPNNNFHLLISYGWKEILPYDIPLNISSHQLGGAHIQFLVQSPVPRLPFFYFTYK